MTRRRIATLASSIVSASCWAAQPLVTDDAAVLPSKACQLEAWIYSTHGGNAYAAQPACNFFDAVEVSVGAARDRAAPDAPTTFVQMQAKTVLSHRAEGNWSIGVAAGSARDTAAPHGKSAFQSHYAKALASWYPRDDMQIDFNVGGANVYGTGTFVLAGIAVQYAFVENVQALAEIFHGEPGPAKYQVGARYAVVPNRFETYVSYGNAFSRSSSTSWIVIGIRLQTAQFLP